MLNAQTTPLIDRELFFGNPEISGGQLSPDGTFISFLREYDGIMNIWVKRFDEPFESARPLTDSKRPLYGYAWTEDGRYILYAKDKDGDENINVFVVDPAARTSGKTPPESRNLTPMTDVTAQIYHVSRIDPELFFIGLNDRDKAWHDLYSLKLSTGELKKIFTNEDRITGYEFDWDDNLRLLTRTDEKGNSSILRNDDGKLVDIYQTSVTESAYTAGWDENNEKFYLVTNKGDLNLSTLYLMDPVSEERTLIESDPENHVDFGNLRLDRNTRKIISTSYTDDRSRIYWRDKEWEANYKFLKSQFEGREVSFQSSTNDYSKFLIAVWGDKYASESWFFNAKTKELIHQYTPRPELKNVEEHLAPMTPVRYKSSDGLEIPAYLTTPAGVDVKKLPVVVLVHGGPKGPRDYWGYDSQAQFLANRGYAVLQPNFRASGGYGKEFLNAGDLQWGKLMQDDITWGVKYLINEGIADPKKIAIMGGSYGGYATLAGLAFTPDVYACGVDIVGPSNIFTLLESVPAYWEAAKAYLYGMVGDPTTPEGEKLIREASPLFSAENINKPLLIIQGANDPRVKQAEADQIVIALRDKGQPVTYILADDEGHGFAKAVNNMAMYAAVEKFLADHIGGRYQKEMPIEVKDRLREMTVDINTVTYNSPADADAVSNLELTKTNWKEGAFNYDVSVSVQGQKMKMSTARTVSKKGKQIIVKDVTQSPQGEGIDEVTFDENRKPVARQISQMGQQIRIEYGEGEAKVNISGNEMTMEFEGALLTDGPGADLVIGSLPLEVGYSVVVNIPDMSTMKTKKATITVEGEETLHGETCYVVRVVNNENKNDTSSYYINKSSRMAMQIEQVVPAMGNAEVVTSLQR